jgi:hypothetical protein
MLNNNQPDIVLVLQVPFWPMLIPFPSQAFDLLKLHGKYNIRQHTQWTIAISEHIFGKQNVTKLESEAESPGRINNCNLFFI